MKWKLGIVGNGFVGQATKALACHEVSLVVYDRDPKKCEPLSTTWDDVSACNVVMVSVPTPMGVDGSCSIRIVDSVVQELRARGTAWIVVRSTVPVGYSESRNVFFMPEFLTEARWADDFRATPIWVMGVDGGPHPDFQQVMQEIFSYAKEAGHIVSDTLRWMTTREAEAVKYFRNCFLATKVSFCNEFYNFCASHGIDYDQVASVAASDARIGTSHTRVPGPDGQRGFGGTCFPKDMASLVHQFQLLGIPSPLLSAAIQRNLVHDRPQRDWEADVGRAVEDITQKP